MHSLSLRRAAVFARLGWVGAVILGFASCSFDTGLPESPQRGRLLGTVDPGGHLPKSGETVTVSGENGDQRTVTTDDTGAFVFADLAPGLYTVGLALPGFAKFNSGLVRVRAGQDTDVGALVPDWLQNTPQEATLMGVVKSTSGSDITGTKVEFVLASTAIAQVVVASDGAFVIRLPPGTFVMRATNPAYVTLVSDPVTLMPAELKDLSKAPLLLDVDPATVSGVVMQERDGAAPVPAPGVNLVIETGQNTSTDATGHFLLTGLAAGTHQLQFALAGFHDPVASHAVKVAAGQTVTLDPVTLQLNRGTIVGTVKLGDRAPVSGARVEVSGTRYAALVSPDAADPSQGGFILANVPVGQWVVTARKDQYSTSSAMATVAVDAPFDVGTLTLARLQGDFLIEDSDATNVYGYTRTTAVTLNFNKFPTTGVTGWRASEDGSFDGGVFLPYTSDHQPFVLGAQEGVHTVYAQYQDNTGQVSQAFTSNIVLDTVAPAVSSVVLESTGTSGGTKYTNVAQALRLKVQASDGAGGSGVGSMQVGESVDGSGHVTGPGSAKQTYQVDAVLTRSTTSDGPQTVYVQAIDLAGNVSAAVSDVIVVDVTKPTGSIAIARGPKATDDGYTNTAFVNVTETYSDGVDGGAVLVKFANAVTDLDSAVYQSASSATGWFLNPQNEGVQTVYARFRDVAGNESTDALGTIAYDVTPPNPAALVALSPAVTNSPLVTLSLTTNPADLSTTQALTVSDEATFTGATTVGPSAFPMSGQTVFTLSSGDGVRTVYARFRDKAGNDAVASTQVTLDTQAPTGSFTLVGTLADGTSSNTVSATNVISIVISAGGATEYRLGDSSMTSCPSTGYSPLVATTLTNQTLPANGVVTLCLRDAAGNGQALLTQTMTLDTAAPSGCSLTVTGKKTDGVTAAPAGKTGIRQVAVAVSACPGAAEMAIVEGPVTCSVSASLSWVPYATSASLVLGGADGARAINGCVRDVARNVAALTAGGIVLDTTAPIGPNIAIDGKAPYINLAQTTARGGNVGIITGGALNATEWALTEDTGAFGAWAAIAATPFTFGGTGVRTIFAKFRDDVGNETTTVYDSINIDVSPPSLTGVTFAAVPSPGAQPGFVNVASVSLTLTGAPVDAVGAQLAQTSGGLCPASVFSGIIVHPLQTAADFALSGPDGAKTLCAQLLDAAGNPSGALSPVVVTLDTVAPTAPVITTGPRTYNIAQALSAGLPALTVTTAAGVTELNFDRYERAGGTLTGWTTNGTTDATRTSTSFSYTLQPDRANTLRLRAVDKAGNASPEDTVVISWDNTRPNAPTLKNQWVDNATGRSTVSWLASASPDVANYRVHYGPVAGNTAVTPVTGFTGANAVEGLSPIQVSATGANDQSLTLTGLTDSTVTWVTVTAVDLAGNESSAPASNSELGVGSNFRQTTLEPNAVSLNRTYQLPISGAGLIYAVAIAGDRAYLAGRSGFGCSGGSTTLTTVDLSTLTSALSLGHIVTQGLPTVTSSLTYADNLGCTALAPQVVTIVDMLVDGPWLFLGSGSKVRIYSLLAPGVPSLVTTLDVGVPNVQSLSLIGDRLFVSADPSIVAVNVQALYDGNAATLPGVTDIIGTVTAPGGDVAGRWVTPMNVSRDRLVQFTHNGGENLAYLATSALGGSPTFTTAANYVAVTGDYAGGTVSRKQVTSGNYLYYSDFTNFSVLNLRNLWSSTTAGPGLNSTTDLIRQLASPGGWGLDVAGSYAFSVELNGTSLRTIDLSDPSALSEGGYLVGTGLGSFSTPEVYGNYLVMGGTDSVSFFEIATPRSMHQVALSSVGASGMSNDVAPGFFFSGDGVTYDLHRLSSFGPISPMLDYGAYAFDYWSYDMARFDDFVVSAQGQGMVVFDASKQTDRDATTNWSTADGVASVFSVTTKRVTGLAAYGNFLIAAESRSDGLWLEVFDARRLRNRQLGAFDVNTQSKGSFQVAPITTTNGLWATLTVVDGRAIIGLDDSTAAAPNPGVYIVDIRPLIDDSAVGSPSVMGTVALTNVHETVVKGTWLYAATAAALSIVDIKEVMDENAGTSLPGSPTRTDFAALAQGSALKAYGSFLFQAGRNGGSIQAVDISQPLSPTIVSTFPLPLVSFSGYAGIEGSYSPAVKPDRRSLSIAGPNLYYTYTRETRVIQLE